MDLTIPTCNSPECTVTLVPRTCMGRRGDRTVTFEGHGWRCSRCADPDTGLPGLDFLDGQLLMRNEAALAAAWMARYGEPLPPSGRPGRKPEQPRTERLAVMLTEDEVRRIDASRGERSRSEFVRDAIDQRLGKRSA